MGFLLLSGGTALPALSSVQAAVTEPGHTVTLTAYNAVPEQTDGDPLTTASGAVSNPEVVAARSVDLADDLPFGTIIEVVGPNSSQGTCGYSVVAPAIGYRVIADSMNKRYSDRIDILFGTEAEYTTLDKGMKNAAEVLGICTGVTIRVVGYVNVSRIPDTQEELATIVNVGTELALK